jgi:hypothetical protein
VDSLSSIYAIEGIRYSYQEDLRIEKEPNRFVVLIRSSSTPTKRRLQFCKQLAAILGLEGDKLSIVMCTDQDFATQYLDGEGIGQQVQERTDDAGDSSASHHDASLNQVEITEAGGKAIRPNIPLDSDSVDRVLTQQGALAQPAGLADPALIRLNVQSISDSAASLSLAKVSSSPPNIQSISTGVKSTVTSMSRSGSTHISHPTSGKSLSEASQGLINPSESVGVSRAEPKTGTTPGEYTNGVLGEYFVRKSGKAADSINVFT